MPETVRTLRYYHIDEPCDYDAVMRGDAVLHVPTRLLDALVGAQGRVVYTAEDVEAAAKAAYARHNTPDRTLAPPLIWEELSARKRGDWFAIARAAITAAGGMVPMR